MGINERLEALKDALRDPDAKVRQNAAESLSRIEVANNLDTYIRMLKDDDRSVRIQAIYILGESSIDRSIELLRMQMTDPDDDVRAAVIHTLNSSSGNYRKPEIRAKAVDIAIIGLGDSNPAIRTSAADVLAEYKDPQCSEVLLSVLSDEEGKEGKKVTISVLLALGAIGDKKSLPAIIKEAKTDDIGVKEAALKALGMLGDPRAESCLMDALEDDNTRLRMQAAKSLGMIRD